MALDVTVAAGSLPITSPNREVGLAVADSGTIELVWVRDTLTSTVAVYVPSLTVHL